jgi:hypothetical protein
MTDFDKIKAKLKKLFALSRSSNANEAALALEMAQKLMAEHGIERNAVGEFEIIEEEIKGNSGKRPPSYETRLISGIAKAFGCQCAYGSININEVWSETWGHTFVGLEHRVKIAAFIGEVLLRKLKKARREYIKKLSRVRSRGNKIKRADTFCLSWVLTVNSKLVIFANTEEEQTAIDNYVVNLKWGDNLKTIFRESVKSAGIDDFLKGRHAGAGIEIQHGVEGRESGSRLIAAQ